MEDRLGGCIREKEVTVKVTQKVTEEVTKSEAISTIEFMKNGGRPEDFIRKYAIEKKVSMKTVDEILGSNETKKTVHT